MQPKDPKRPQLPPADKGNGNRNQQNGRSGPQNPLQRTPRIPTWIVATLIIALIGWYIWEVFGPSQGQEDLTVSYSAIVQQIEAKNVKTATLSETEITVDLDKPSHRDTDAKAVVENPPADASNIRTSDNVQATLPQGVDNPDLLSRLEASGATINGKVSSGSIWTSIIFSFLPFAATFFSTSGATRPAETISDSGDTTCAMPSPISAISGKVPVQKLWMPKWVSQARPAKAMATTMLPLAIGKRGPIRSDHRPTGPDRSAIDADSGRKMKPASASLSLQPAIRSIGR